MAPRPPDAPRASRLPLVLALALLTVVCAMAARQASVAIDGTRYYYLDDDQMISMRYARNLAEGRGLVWNAGERVEGYTNFGWVLVMAAVAYTILATLLVRHEGPDSTLAKAFGADVKGKVSLALYATGIALSFVRPWLGIACYVIVAVIWFIPDRRIERVLKER